jgi:methylglutaconyl-CoA hydratase
MTDEVVRIERKDHGVVYLSLNRPHKGNCYNQEMLAGIARHLAALEDDVSVRVVVLRGAGRHFCAGADMEYVRTIKNRPSDTAGGVVGLDDVLVRLDGFPKPTVAAVSGACLGGGIGFIACCDAVVATDSAFFSVPEIRLGFAPTTLLPYFVRALGVRYLRRYGLSGDRISAERALQIGLVHDLSNDAEFELNVERVADAMLRGAPRAASLFKAAVLGSSLPTPGEPDDALELAEGLASVREKRNPSWYRPGAV